jgi:hypothetical protein
MAEQREEPGRDPHPAELLRRLGIAELEIAAPVGGDPSNVRSSAR